MEAVMERTPVDIVETLRAVQQKAKDRIEQIDALVTSLRDEQKALREAVGRQKPTPVVVVARRVSIADYTEAARSLQVFTAKELGAAVGVRGSVAFQAARKLVRMGRAVVAFQGRAGHAEAPSVFRFVAQQ